MISISNNHWKLPPIHLMYNLQVVSVQLDSTQQEHLKALTKHIRRIERAKHHSQLLEIATDSKRPPRELITMVSPMIPGTPGAFTA